MVACALGITDSYLLCFSSLLFFPHYMYFCKLFYASHTAILLIFLFLLCQLKWLLSYMFCCFLQVGMSSRSKVLTWVTWKLFQRFTQVTPFRWSAVSPALCGKPNLCQVHSSIPGFLRIEEIGVWESSNIYTRVFLFTCVWGGGSPSWNCSMLAELGCPYDFDSLSQSPKPLLEAQVIPSFAGILDLPRTGIPY